MRQYHDRFILIMGIPYLERQQFYWSMALVSFQTPTCWNYYQHIPIRYWDAALPVSGFSLYSWEGRETVLWWEILSWLYGISISISISITISISICLYIYIYIYIYIFAPCDLLKTLRFCCTRPSIQNNCITDSMMSWNIFIYQYTSR